MRDCAIGGTLEGGAMGRSRAARLGIANGIAITDNHSTKSFALSRLFVHRFRPAASQSSSRLAVMENLLPEEL